MPFGTTLRNAAVNGIAGAITHIGLADESNTEIAGGSPAYARKAVVWHAPAAGVVDNNGALTFDIQAGDAVFFIHFYDAAAAGNDLGWYAAGGFPVQAGVVTAVDDLIQSEAHGLVNNDRVVLMDVGDVGLAAGLVEGTVYYVVSAATDSFKVSLTLGGAAVNVTANGECYLQKLIPETYGNQGTYTIADGDLDLTGTLI